MLYELAWQLGIEDVDALSRRMSHEQLIHWCAFMKKRADARQKAVDEARRRR